ncbi:hypothetical protein C347_00201 [Cryptococcus neoformans AD2-60a]|nr:hypothetical protein C347_00201 [Cryptococcus neoformans var. grubii AD2-60a]
MGEINNSSPYKQRDIRGWGIWLMVTNASPTLVKQRVKGKDFEGGARSSVV